MISFTSHGVKEGLLLGSDVVGAGLVDGAGDIVGTIVGQKIHLTGKLLAYFIFV